MPKPQDLVEIIKRASVLKATDIHISAYAKPKVRINGDLVDLSDYDVLSPSDAQKLCYSVMTETQRKVLESEMDVDFSFSINGLARIRANVYTERGSITGAFRFIPFEIPPIETLGLPESVIDLTDYNKGLILVTGATGSGKSTTIAAMVDKINRERNAHIITLEDPIEYVYKHKRSLVNQREIGNDVSGFSRALKNILRQDPDVIVVGEMRDLETIKSALTVAETGHLVFATLHTNSAPETIDRIVDVFPPNQQNQIRTQLSVVLRGIITQVLIKRTDGRGRVLACEVLIPNPAVRNLIRENKIPQIYSIMQTGQAETGMITLNQSLSKLYSEGIIDYQSALDASVDKKLMKKELDRMLVKRR